MHDRMAAPETLVVQLLGMFAHGVERAAAYMASAVMAGAVMRMIMPLVCYKFSSVPSMGHENIGGMMCPTKCILITVIDCFKQSMHDLVIIPDHH